MASWRRETTRGDREAFGKSVGRAELWRVVKREEGSDSEGGSIANYCLGTKGRKENQINFNEDARHGASNGHPSECLPSADLAMW